MAKIQNTKANMLDAALNATKRMAKDSGVSVDFYDAKYAPYFAEFVRTLKGDKKLSDSECLQILNDDFLRNVNGGFIKNVNKVRNISQAYTIYKNAVAYAESQIAKEYGTDNYYELEKSANPQARVAFEQFEEWQKQKDQEFEQLADITKEMYVIQHSKNPMKELCQNGILLTPFISSLIVGGGLTGVGLLGAYRKAKKNVKAGKKACSAGVYGWVAGGLALGLIVGFMMSNNSTKSDEAKAEELDLLAEEFGYTDSAEFVNNMNNAVVSYLTPDEAKAVYDNLITAGKDSVSADFGFESNEDAINAINEVSVNKELYYNEVLNNIENEQQFALESFANQNSFDSYNNLVTFLNQHKTSGTAEIESGWSSYAYDSPTAKALATQLDYIEAHYNYEIAQLRGYYWPRNLTVVEDETLNELSMKLSAQEVIVNSAYENLITDDANIFYSPDTTTQLMGVEAIEIANKYGEDTIEGLVVNSGTTDAKMSDLTLDSDMQDSLSSALDGLQAVDVSPVEIAAGVGVGAGLTVALKNSKLISDAAKLRRANKVADKLDKVNKQMEDDLER